MDSARTPPPPSNSHSPQAMDASQPSVAMDYPTSSIWNFADLLDFTSDDHLFPDPWDPSAADGIPLTLPPANPDADLLPPSVEAVGRIRKRDPRLVCSNFLAGRVPCACPEIDEMLEEEGLPGKKRTRTHRSGSGSGSGSARCQVPGCEADISELKGYHRRHRVCLHCANAPSVMLEDETKRYCQQCGKFHILLDFDEGKRSCRRKLERHNNRRRRKFVSPDSTVENESLQDVNTDDVQCEDEDGKDILCSSIQLSEKELPSELGDGQVSLPCSAPEFQTVNHTDSAVSIISSQDVQLIGPKDNPKHSLSQSYCDKRSTYTSVCPTGRISFKLYDWNPAEFPRRLRLQVFQWLSSMPVELEGYIRPGCTFLTMFIAMPKIMWGMLCEDPVSSIGQFVIQPGNVLSARRTFFVYLHDMVFCVLKGGSSVMKIKVEDRAPRLHYVYPMCFEVGTPIEFVACGSNLLQSKVRFLVSFSGKYLPCESSFLSSDYRSGEGNIREIEYQFYKIHISQTCPYIFGPAFIEVENESGLSNFIPVLFADKEVCSEMRIIQQTMDDSFSKSNPDFLSTKSFSETFIWRQETISEFLVDIGWLLKEPSLESLHHSITASQIRQFTGLLNFLMESGSTVILEKIFLILQNLMDRFEVDSGNRGSLGADIDFLMKKMDIARDSICCRSPQFGGSLPSGVSAPKSPNDVISPVQVDQARMSLPNRCMENGDDKIPGPIAARTCTDRDNAFPLLDFEGAKSEALIKKKSSRQVFLSRPALYAIATAAVCFGVCAVFLHPHKVGDFAVYVQRCLFDNILVY
ncbi:hypothetical protein SAY87_010687 [Trapa incisa]|uniref:SBP-type domain-containing protein n=1 Tax=Trapa incisa TaxID=236973 RepID=A0AAN7GJX3_9MYRT|nr:hypothetical protein SAY87_010687 [Trapa incisa]